ncbi:hypothetical protein [Microbacterium capsulatum]|uniref:Uncharacterized protein n=1 Tax=Microbacterium capsulatum TaxID=3041921 RepID=A0ABU0XKU2_9MICO|nr:hypothetical protein [Microbacterium sp. ASV81]MDQ4214740.1 hypothetical protein [Microbacterium sp. ASV81]
MTSELLSFARRRSQRLGRDGARAVVEVGPLTIERPALVINRMTTPPDAAWRSAVPGEREYAAAELTAFVLSWLRALDCPVRNRPEPVCLAGPAPHPQLAQLFAQRSGLACGEGIRSGTYAQLVVLDGEILNPEEIAQRAGTAMPRGFAASVSSFAHAVGADTALIGIDMIVGEGQWLFQGVTPLPALPAAGSFLVDGLIALAESHRSAAPREGVQA